MKVFRATVADNADADELGKLSLVIPELSGEDEPYPRWVPPLVHNGAGPGSGWWNVPPVGAQVLVQADQAGRLRWTGGEWGDVNTPPELLVGNYPLRAGFTSPQGLHALALDEDHGLILLVSDPADPDGVAMYLTMDPDTDEVKLGTIAGNTLVLNPDQVLIMSAAGHLLNLHGSDGIALVHSGGAELISLEDGLLKLYGTDVQIAAGACTIVGQGGITLTSDLTGLAPVEPLVLGITFLTDLAAALTELAAAPTMFGLPTTNTLAMVASIATALGAGAPYLSTVTSTE